MKVPFTAKSFDSIFPLVFTITESCEYWGNLTEVYRARFPELRNTNPDGHCVAWESVSGWFLLTVSIGQPQWC